MNLTKLKDIIKNIDRPLFLVTFVLFVLGLIMIFSASNVTSYMSGGSPYAYFLRQGLFLLGSFIFCIFLVKFNTKFYGFVSNILLVVFTILLIVLLVYGKSTNYATSWFYIGPFGVQPSEFIKVIMIVFMARFYEKYEAKLNNWFIAVIPLLIAMVITFLIMFQPDLGTAIIFAVLVGLIFLSSPVSKRIKTAIIFLILGMVIVAALAVIFTGGSILQSRQLSRLNFTRPCDRLLDTGNQVCNGYIAINNGGLSGIGLGNSTQKYLYLPYPYTDFIFAVIVEELGLVTAIGIILAYIFVLYRILKIGKASTTNRGALICYGVAVYIFLHIAVNLMGLFGLMPMTGVPLPFMSYGGSFTLCVMVSLAFVQRVNIETKLHQKNHQKV